MKKAVLHLILRVLYRTMRVLERRDCGVAADLAQLTEGTVVRLRAGMADDAPQLTVMRRRSSRCTMASCLMSKASF